MDQRVKGKVIGQSERRESTAPEIMGAENQNGRSERRSYRTFAERFKRS